MRACITRRNFCAYSGWHILFSSFFILEWLFSLWRTVQENSQLDQENSFVDIVLPNYWLRRDTKTMSKSLITLLCQSRDKENKNKTYTHTQNKNPLLLFFSSLPQNDPLEPCVRFPLPLMWRLYSWIWNGALEKVCDASFYLRNIHIAVFYSNPCCIFVSHWLEPAFTPSHGLTWKWLPLFLSVNIQFWKALSEKKLRWSDSQTDPSVSLTVCSLVHINNIML